MKINKTLILLIIFSITLIAYPINAQTILSESKSFEVGISPVINVITDGQPAIFELTIANHNSADVFNVFTINTDFSFQQISVPVSAGKTKTVKLKIYPQTKTTGLYDVTVIIKSQLTSEFVEVGARIRFVNVEEAIKMDLIPSSLKVSDKKVTLVVKNLENLDLGNIKMDLKSQIFSKTFEFKLGEKETKKFDIDVDLSKAEGGRHNISINLYVGDKSFYKNIPYNLEVIRDLKKYEEVSGFLVQQRRVVFENKGNVKEKISIVQNTTIFEKLFSYFSVKPSFSVTGGVIKEKWNLIVDPYSTKTIVVKTNYLIPLLILAFLIIGFAFTVSYQSKRIVVSKTAMRVKSNRGSAFKITIRVRNRKEAIRDVRVRDFLPKNMKVYSKFDFMKPTTISSNYVEWSLPIIHEGEERIFTYYIYTEKPYTGELFLPPAVVNYLTLHRDPQTDYSAGIKIEAIPKVISVAASKTSPVIGSATNSESKNQGQKK